MPESADFLSSGVTAGGILVPDGLFELRHTPPRPARAPPHARPNRDGIVVTNNLGERQRCARPHSDVASLRCHDGRSLRFCRSAGAGPRRRGRGRRWTGRPPAARRSTAAARESMMSTREAAAATAAAAKNPSGVSATSASNEPPRVDRLAARELTPAGECPVAVAGRDLENLSRAHLFRRGAANIERPDAVGAGASGRIYPT